MVKMLYFVTTNKGKFEIIQSVLQQYGLDLQQKPMTKVGRDLRVLISWQKSIL